jgi:hypothetical protein
MMKPDEAMKDLGALAGAALAIVLRLRRERKAREQRLATRRLRYRQVGERTAGKAIRPSYSVAAD